VSFKPTEYIVRQLLIEELKRRGVKVTPEISFVSPVGRLVPDLLLYINFITSLKLHNC